MKYLYIASPLEQFEVYPLLSIEIPALEYIGLSITNLGLYTLTLALIILLYHTTLFNKDTLLQPNKWQISVESSYASVQSIVREQIGSELYFPFLYALFFFILISNLIGNVPYSFAITSSIMVSLGLSFTILIGVSLLGLQLHGWKFFSYFIPSGTPLSLTPLLVLIELISYLARAFSLGIRLFANIVAGHTLLKILSTFLYQMFSAGIMIFVLTLIPFTFFIS